MAGLAALRRNTGVTNVFSHFIEPPLESAMESDIEPLCEIVTLLFTELLLAPEEEIIKSWSNPDVVRTTTSWLVPFVSPSLSAMRDFYAMPWASSMLFNIFAYLRKIQDGNYLDQAATLMQTANLFKALESFEAVFPLVATFGVAFEFSAPEIFLASFGKRRSRIIERTVSRLSDFTEGGGQFRELLTMSLKAAVEGGVLKLEEVDMEIDHEVFEAIYKTAGETELVLLQRIALLANNGKMLTSIAFSRGDDASSAFSELSILWDRAAESNPFLLDIIRQQRSKSKSGAVPIAMSCQKSFRQVMENLHLMFDLDPFHPNLTFAAIAWQILETDRKHELSGIFTTDIHNVNEVKDAFDALQQTGFDTVLEERVVEYCTKVIFDHGILEAGGRDALSRLVGCPDVAQMLTGEIRLTFDSFVQSVKCFEPDTGVTESLKASHAILAEVIKKEKRAVEEYLDEREKLQDDPEYARARRRQRIEESRAAGRVTKGGVPLVQKEKEFRIPAYLMADTTSDAEPSHSQPEKELNEEEIQETRGQTRTFGPDKARGGYVPKAKAKAKPSGKRRPRNSGRAQRGRDAKLNQMYG